MNIYSLLTIILLSAIISVFLRKNSNEMSILFVVACVVTVLIISSDLIVSVIQNITSINEIDFDFLDICVKILILSICSKLAMSICEDASEKTLSNLIQIITKFSVIIISFPLFEELVNLIRIVVNL